MSVGSPGAARTGPSAQHVSLGEAGEGDKQVSGGAWSVFEADLEEGRGAHGLDRQFLEAVGRPLLQALLGDRAQGEVPGLQLGLDDLADLFEAWTDASLLAFFQQP